MTQKIQDTIATLRTRIAADTLKVQELEAQLAVAANLANVGAGFVVTFKVGRADTRRTVEGVVQGRGIVKDVDTVRVQVGEGFDTELFNVKVNELLSAKAPGVADEAADLTPVDEAAPAVGASDDDLLNSVLG